MLLILPNATYPGLHWKPLDTTIRQLITWYCPGGRQGSSKRNDNKNGPTLLAILMAVAVRRYNTAQIAQWRRSRALVVATGHHHWASIATNNCNWSCMRRYFFSFFIIKQSVDNPPWGMVYA
jgi:hypothetical protein